VLEIRDILVAPVLRPVGRFVVAERADGLAWSVQPDGSVETRPAGTAGAYELAAPLGSLLVYQPLGPPGRRHVFLHVEALPNG